MEPTSAPRYRCTACGNLTRFEVTVSRRTRSFHHYTIGGDLTIEDTEVLSEQIEPVVCRGCGTAASVVQVDAADIEGLEASDQPADPSAVGSTEA